MTYWVVSVWDGYSNQIYEREGTYDQVRMTCSGYPSSHIWSIEEPQSYARRMAAKTIATPIQKKFLDGSIVTPEYEAAISVLISGAAKAEECFSLDELEEFASEGNSLAI